MARGHTTRVIFTVKIWKFFSDRTRKFISRKLKYIFTKKTAPQLLGHIGLQTMKVGVKRVLSYWRPLLVGLRENTDTLRCLILCDDFLQIHFIRGHVYNSIKWRSFNCTCFLRLTRRKNRLIDLLLCSVWLCFLKTARARIFFSWRHPRVYARTVY